MERRWLTRKGNYILKTNYNREYEHILNIAVTNGSDKKLVDKKITNFRKLKHIKKHNHIIYIREGCRVQKIYLPSMVRTF